MKQSRYILVFGVIFVLVLALVLIVWLVPRSPLLSGLIEHQYPGIIPASSYARSLYSSDRDTVMSGFYHLTKRANPIAVPRAIELLTHDDDYIWLNAALYLGACKRQEAVPYLIKALRHSAWRSDLATAEYLHNITGADFCTDFARWQQWWLAGHPESQFDWDSHLGSMPRLSKPK